MDIEAEIQKLRKNILDQYEKDVLEIRADFERQEEDNLQRLEDKKNALIKQLDDRLEVMKQFPSALEADKVASVEYFNEHSFYEDLEIGHTKVTQIPPGKWKILVMAKKIE